MVSQEIQGVNSGGPGVTISGVMAYGPPPPLPRPSFPDEHRWQIGDTLSLVHGRHAIKLGGDINLIHEMLINLFQGEGVYSYSGSPTAAFGNWVADVYGVNLGDGLTGRHYTSFTQAYDPNTKVGRDDFWDRDYAGFVEDSWRARSNLTVNLGLRYEIQTVPSSPNPNTTIPLLAALTFKINTDSNNFGPRIRLAWQPLKNTVVRGGYGIFYGKTTNSTYYALRVENGIYQQQFNCPPRSTCAPAFPNVIFTPPGPALSAPLPGALAPQVINTNPPLGVLATHGVAGDFVNPLVHEGELTVERRLSGNLGLSVGYVFSRALHLPLFVDANLAPPTTSQTYAVLGSAGALAQTISEPFYTQRLDPSTGIVATGYSVVNAWYNGLLVTLRRPLGQGVEFLANYTFSKSIDDGALQVNVGTFSGTDVILNPENIKQENRVIGAGSAAPVYGERRLESVPQNAKQSGAVAPQVIYFLYHRHGNLRAVGPGQHQRLSFEWRGWRCDGRRNQQFGRGRYRTSTANRSQRVHRARTSQRRLARYARVLHSRALAVPGAGRGV